MNRREFLGLTIGTPVLANAGIVRPRFSVVDPEILVVGGGLGGCAAALAATHCGRGVWLAVEGDWLGGQLTSQAAPPDEHRWIESHGSTGSWRALRTAIREFYRKIPSFQSSVTNISAWNPGNCWVSRLGCEPRFAAEVILRLLRPAVERGLLKILWNHTAFSAEVSHDRVRGVLLLDATDGRLTAVHPRLVLDATDLGDLLPMTGAEWVSGAESASETDELHAPSTADLSAQQAFTWAMALEHQKGEDHRQAPPVDYASWKEFVPTTHPVWPGRLFSWDCPDPATRKLRRLGFNPEGLSNGPNLWTYRRVRDASQWRNRADITDVSIINWPQNDYLKGSLIGNDPSEAIQHRLQAKQMGLCLLHWLQNEAPRPDGKFGWPGLKLCPEVMGTSDGFAKAPYIRESRRMRTELTLTEAHIGAEQRHLLLAGKRKEVSAESFEDSIGVGAYRIDLHPTPSGDNYLDISAFPYQIPLRSLIPVRLENLLPAAKNFGTTHISNGCCRLHPVEWNVGEVAGHLAAWCLESGEPARHLIRNERLRQRFQDRLARAGIETAWPTENRVERL